MHYESNLACKKSQGQPRFINCAKLVGPTPQCYIPSPTAIGLLVPEKVIDLVVSEKTVFNIMMGLQYERPWLKGQP